MSGGRIKTISRGDKKITGHEKLTRFQFKKTWRDVFSERNEMTYGRLRMQTSIL